MYAGKLIAPWWHYLLRGLLALVFGVILLAWPTATTLVVLVLFGIFVLVEGLLMTAAAIYAARQKERWVPALILGLVGIIIAVVTFVRPSITAVALLVVIALWAIIYGAAQLFVSMELPKELKMRWLVGIIGALAIILGVLLIAFPISGIFAIILFIGIYALVMGIMQIITGLWVRSAIKEVQPA